jgi:NAD(P)-dependent dehydrogenase (short-subunit alcohol dehydrogenase family)
MTLAGKVIVITGAGSGLGRALAVGFAERGAMVAGLGRRQPPLSETGALAPSGRFSAHVADVADALAVDQAMREIAARHGRIDVLFNNAAVYPKLGFLEQDAASWMHALAVNVGGAANCCRAVLPIMMRQGAGRIINVGSFADKAPIPRSSAYAASKGALHALTRAIAADLGEAHAGITCYEWVPGHLKTQMSDFTGMPPEACVEWAARIVALPSTGPASRSFEGDREQLPARSLRSRIASRLRFWQR